MAEQSERVKPGAASTRSDPIVPATPNEQTDRSRLITELVAVPPVAVIQLGIAISLATLIFAGPLAPGAGRAAVVFIVATAILSIVLGLTTRMTSYVAGVQDSAAIVAAAVAASIAAQTTGETQLATVMTMLGVSAALTGIVMFLIGRFGWGSYGRVLPAPVIGGFMAGTGWLLLRGGVEVMTGRSFGLDEIGDLFDWSVARYMVVGLVIALLMVATSINPRSGPLVSAAIAIVTVGFHLIGRSVSSLEQLEEDGWLIGPFPDRDGLPVLGPTDLGNADWLVIAKHSLPIAAICAVAVVGLLLNLSGAESVTGERVEVDHEFRATGAANVAVGIAGGTVGYYLIGDSLLARQLGARTNRVSLISGVLALLVAFVGYDLIGLVPRAVAGGMLSGLGIILFAEWLRDLRHSVDKFDAAISVVMPIAIAFAGILSGVAIGLVVAALLFVARYSRVDPVRHRISAAGRSNVDREPEAVAALAADPGRIVAFELQGYLFFGSVMRLRSQLDHELTVELADGEGRWVVFDLRRVTGLDGTALSALTGIVSELNERGVVTLWSGMSPFVAEHFEAQEIGVDNAHDDLDHAIAVAEDELLSETERRRFDPRATADFVPTATTHPAILNELCVSRSVEAGEVIVEIGDEGRDLSIVVSGTFTAWATLDDGTQRRLRRIGKGAVIGELAFITGQPRTATVIADTAAQILLVERDRFDVLADEDPDAALEVQQWLLLRLAGRLAATSSLVRELMR